LNNVKKTLREVTIEFEHVRFGGFGVENQGEVLRNSLLILTECFTKFGIVVHPKIG
jgi:hypothetical protein